MTVARLLKRRLGTSSDSLPKNIPVTLCNLEVWSSCPYRSQLCSEKGIKDEIRSELADLALTEAGSELVDGLVESIAFMSLPALRQKVGDEVFHCICEEMPELEVPIEP